MSQHDYDIANALGATVRADINNALLAIVSQNSGASAPSTTFAFMWWADTTTGLLKIRNAANSAWITVGTLAAANLGLLSLAGGSLTGALNEAAGADIVSATTTDIGAATGNYVKVTGTTTITGLGTVQAGTTRIVRFAGALALTHNATSLILPGAANITTVADDRGIFVSLGGGNWICIAYTRADGTPVISSSDRALITTKTADYTLVAADNGGTFIMNSASAHIFTLPDDATAGNGWSVRIINRGAGVCSVTRAGTDTIASGGSTALTSIKLSQGDAGDITADGVSHGIFWWRGQRHYDSGQQTITSAGALTLAHGLGVRPAVVETIMHCVTGEAGFSAGDEILQNPGATTDGGSIDHGFSGKIDATNITIRFAPNTAVFRACHATTGTQTNLTNGNWAAIWRAWVYN